MGRCLALYHVRGNSLLTRQECTVTPSPRGSPTHSGGASAEVQSEGEARAGVALEPKAKSPEFQTSAVT